MGETGQSWDDLERKLEEAAQLEKQTRICAWLDLPLEICGIEIRPMTLRHYTLLESAGNPFVCGGAPSAGAIAQFLWFLSPEFCLDDGKQQSFLKQVSRLNYAGALRAIKEHIEDVFFDLVSSGGDSKKPGDRTLQASLIHTFAKNYGWTVAEVMDAPLQQLFQLLRCLMREDGDPAHTPIQTRIKRDWLQSINGGVN